MTKDDLRYPIGTFVLDSKVTPEKRAVWITEIAEAPRQLRAAVAGLSDAQLDTPYRPEGWTVRQVVHHLADSHMNAVVRTRLALTEEVPLVKTYDEAAWARLLDARTAPVDLSLSLLEALHRRWAILLRGLDEAGFAREFQHPEIGLVNVDFLVQVYAWHGKHHVAHVRGLRERKGWG